MFLIEYVQKWAIRIFYILFLFFMFYRIFLSGGTALDRSVSYISYPFLKVHSAVANSMESIKKHFQAIDSLKREVEQSHEEIDILEARVAELEQALSFQDRTRELVSFSHRYKDSFHVLSKVLMKKYDSKDHLLYLDVGSKRGIQKNMIVVYKNCLVGRVVHVYPWYCEVACITDRRCKITAELYKKDIKGIYEGKNEFQASLRFVPHFKNTEVEDRVYSAGEGLIYPKGFLLGTIASIKSGAVDQDISIQPAVDFNLLEYVYVIKDL